MLIETAPSDLIEFGVNGDAPTYTVGYSIGGGIAYGSEILDNSVIY